ncbi:DUF7933 domain-containing protein [Winogradskyella thalassocola]|uniref:Conserved repeat domain-containing protein/gliding motility-associated C-terminal domain-containing protein n=1 Tax=Winogradskyella thalassocola TaxID=262004 RepID=A0A1G7X7Q6_9FLAO|nr:gliding motility-associated C-terminal domain-containing protein [Winogradskyella thalassocola]SDG80157.1 conserved repeat domain-containing protein/gliding motility-associated C-terminal domain-containing protein [Winogradskyella thalassocola]
MTKPLCFLLVLFSSIYVSYSQTTDLSIAIEAQNLSGTPVSQVNIYEDFQYVITVLNSGNSVDNASISINFDTDLTINSYASQNNTNGASDVANISIVNNVLTASIAAMPNNSSVELIVLVTAPTNLGGIAANGTINPPDNIEDTNTSNNQSIISIDVLDIDIDFTVIHEQISPPEGTAINAWGDTVTYQFTITNNSVIDFPITQIEGNLILASSNFTGQPFAEFVSLECIGTNNGTVCPDLTDVLGNSTTVGSSNVSIPTTLFVNSEELEITSGGSITFEMVYRYSNFSCTVDPMPIQVNSFIKISIDHHILSSINSNFVTTHLLEANLCPETDICIETVQVDPEITSDIAYNQEITFITTVCNMGSVETPMRFFLQNLSFPNAIWNIISVNCIETSGPVLCSDFILTSEGGQVWSSSSFILQPNTTITIETVLEYIEPECATNTNSMSAVIRSGTNILDTQLVDSNPLNNYFTNQIELPPVLNLCVESDLKVTKVQTSPELPIGSSPNNTTGWGLVSYEITVNNDGDTDAIIEVRDYMPSVDNGDVSVNGMLVSVECTGTTGTASCFEIENTNIGELFDGVPEEGQLDIFWQIIPEDNWVLPANSSVNFSVAIDWLPECSTSPIEATNEVVAYYVNDITDYNITNNRAEVHTYFAPCVDLVTQTYPEFTQVNTNQAFNWVIDISNSTTSSNATDVLFENTLNSAFTIVGSPSCIVASGAASCMSNFNITGNFISGIIPNMEAGSTVKISIPVTAPSYGGAFNNIAEAIPSAENNEELTPETNISINSVQVIAPVLQKSFVPETIIEGGESELIFTVFNIASNPTQTQISFTDNLPNGVFLIGLPNWIEANGSITTFIGEIGDAFVGIENLVFPEGVDSCTFSVMVSSDVSGTYLNNFQNFTNNNNLDISQTSATLNVIVDTSDVDIEITKTVMPAEAFYGQNVDFTITATNLGTTTATLIEVIDILPQGYEFVSATTSSGVFDDTTFNWNIPSLNPNTPESLVLTASVISSTDLTNLAILHSVNEPDRDLTNNEDHATVEISNCLIIPEGISPNNDGKNDTFDIPCIEDYMDNTLKIYNRYGTQIYEAKNYINTWDGEANMGLLKSSKVLPVGTYFYVLNIRGIDKPFIGYVYLNY